MENNEKHDRIKLLDSKAFEVTLEGKKISLYTLSNRNGCVAQITNYGARLVSLWVPDKQGKMKDIVLGFSSIESYLNAKEKYHGSVIGRYANRIAKGKFELFGKKYNLLTNNNGNHLHGGEKGFSSVVWNVEEFQSQSIRFSYVSKHLEEGYPGNLSVQVTYTLTDYNELKIEYLASTDQPTIVNLTHHAYFNLSGEGSGNIDNHFLQIHADQIIPINKNAIPYGHLDTVNETPFDFREVRALDSQIVLENEQLLNGNGYDHCYVLNNNGKLASVASVKESITGISMIVDTDQPGMQLFTANHLDGTDIGKSGFAYERRSAFCLETQYFPDSPNQSKFPSATLLPEEEYNTITTYKFGIIP